MSLFPTNVLLAWKKQQLQRRQLNFTEQGPSWEQNSCSASGKIIHLLWNPKVRFIIVFTRGCDWNLPSVKCIQSTTLFCKIHFNIILPLTYRCTSSLLPTHFSNMKCLLVLTSYCVLNLASHQEDVWGSGGAAPRILNISNRWWWVAR
jgi:hypothetical protein